MAKWLSEFKKALKKKMPVKIDVNPNKHNKKYEVMGAEQERIGFEQIYVCIDESCSVDFCEFERALKNADKFLFRDYDCNQDFYFLFAIRQDKTFVYIARSKFVNYLKSKFERGFKEKGIIEKKGFDIFKPKKYSLLIIITENPDFSLTDETRCLLRKKYSKIILLNFSCDDVVTEIK